MNHHLQNYNSLTEKLIQTGIIQSSENSSLAIPDIVSDFKKEGNFFEEKSDGSIEIQNGNQRGNQREIQGETQGEAQNIFSINKEQNLTPSLKAKKRLNNYDSNLIENPTKERNVENPIKTAKAIKRFLNFKQNSLLNSKLGFKEAFFARFFPRLYKAKLIKEAMSKFAELNIDTQTLLDKTIPYGENETRYEDLVKFLNYANELQTRLK
mgnify:CR=1 FL=1